MNNQISVCALLLNLIYIRDLKCLLNRIQSGTSLFESHVKSIVFPLEQVDRPKQEKHECFKF